MIVLTMAYHNTICFRDIDVREVVGFMHHERVVARLVSTVVLIVVSEDVQVVDCLPIHTIHCEIVNHLLELLEHCFKSSEVIF